MVWVAVPGGDPLDPPDDRGLNVDPDRLYFVVTPGELEIVVDALRSAGRPELADRFNAVLHRVRGGEDLEQRATGSGGTTTWSHLEQSPYPDPPSIDGRCDRCGWHGRVYAGRYGGYRCAVCFGLQWGWMPHEKT